MNNDKSGLELPEWILALILIVILIAIAIFAKTATNLWDSGDKTGSLAAASALASLVLAFAAILALDQNRALVKAATLEATASRETVQEMQRQRELANRPWLIISRRFVPPEPGEWMEAKYFIVQNIGTGPAVDVKLAARRFYGDPPQYTFLSAEAPGIAAGSEHAFLIDYVGGLYDNDRLPDRNRCIVDDWQPEEGLDGIVAVRYQDWFGTYYRAGGPEMVQPDEWHGRRSTIDQPNWLRCK